MVADPGRRCVIGIHVLREQVAEFDPGAGRWQTLDPDALVADRCLVRPLPVQALLDSALAKALEARGPAPPPERAPE